MQNIEEVEKHLEPTKSEKVSSAPKDKWNLVYFIFLLQGTGVLFPWNAFISAPDYFGRLYGGDIMLYFSVANAIPNVIGLLALLKLAPKIPIKFRIFPAYIITFFVLVAVPILGFAGVHGTVGFVLTIVLVVIQSFCNSALQGGMFGFAGVLPPNYTQALMSGNGIAAVICSFLRIVTKLTIEQNRKHLSLSILNVSASVYFFICSAVILLCVVSFAVVMRMEFVQYYLRKAEGKDEEKRSIINATEDEEEQQNTNDFKPQPSVISVFKKIWVYCSLVCCVFWVTLGVFPGLAVQVPTWYKGTEMVEWLPILIGTTFNIFDFIGRSAPRWIIMIKGKWISIPILLRFIFFPLFIFYFKPEIFGLDAFNDSIPLISMAVLALTNGYFSSLSMMFAPGCVEDYEKETAGTMMTFFLLLGLTLGSNTGLAIGKILGAIFSGSAPYVE
ncbi:hypothetical protein ABK040_012140 [Willaertia magna]